MISDIKFSIITPVYNVEQYLDQCVQSVLGQTYENYELILVNDGSKDSSGAICDRYAQLYPNIKTFHKANGGQLHTREYGIRKATGEYLIFLDSDDYLKTDALQVVHDAITMYQADCVIYGMQRVANGEVLSVTTERLEAPLTITDKRVLFKKVFGSSGYNSLCRKAVKTSLVTGIDYSAYYQLRHAEDLLQSIEMLDGASCTVLIPDVLYNYRVNPGSVTQTNCYENYTLNFQVRAYVLQYLQKNSLFTDEDFKEYRAYAIRLLISEIETIAGFRTSFANKKNLFQKIHDQKYYKDFLDCDAYDRQAVGMKHILFVLFRKKQFVGIVGFVNCIGFLRKLRK